MTQPPQQPFQPVFDVRVPDELEAGVYANFLNVWHTAHEFTFDFGVLLPVTQPPTVPIRVTARVKVPPTLVFEVIRAINQNLGMYEGNLGPIRRPGDSDPLPFPEELLGDETEGSADDDESESS